MSNDTPDNGDFAAYLENLDRRRKTNTTQNPATSTALPISEHSNGADTTDQELSELPPISDDELLTQALASEGESIDYDLDESPENGTDAGADAGAQEKPEVATLAFLGEHALQLADPPVAAELENIPPITDEELMQQALAHPADNEELPSE
ncbi:hypothetical protein [Undibacterium pigrum]|uniref:Uncharacterized protein n=1 Tax=Undibacterium pigrum TaxID=401470 RepID=A0A318JI96_9BURK|nr:hypothetical protein [Undibacterium pigrum]PXX47515.1 hypothetical protein DFR42_1011097 [Undibacterium pigrum]